MHIGIARSGCAAICSRRAPYCAVWGTTILVKVVIVTGKIVIGVEYRDGAIRVGDLSCAMGWRKSPEAGPIRLVIAG